MRRLFVAALLAVCLTLLFFGSVEAGQDSWYSYCGLGLAFNSYSGELEKIHESATFRGRDDEVPLGFDAGVYWPLSERSRTLVGFVFNGGEDHSDNGVDHLEIEFSNFGVSSMHFFGLDRCAGLFVRADLGMAWYKLEASGTEVFSDASNRGFSELGYGGLIGGGYGFHVSRGKAILLNVNYAIRRAGADQLSTFGMTIGLLI